MLSGQDPTTSAASAVLTGLDPEQKSAVTAPTGIVVVRAGAGSGKTTVLTRRIAWRALSGTADIDRTLAITFTRQAATEMRARLASFDLDGKPTIGTFHAIARKLMLQFYEDRNKRAPVIINNRSTVMSTAMGDDARSGGVNDMLNAVDWAHAHMIPVRDAAKRLTEAGIKLPLPSARFTEVFDAYEKTKVKRGVIDLNDFMTSVIVEATKDPRFAESIRFQFRHVSVDEAQDMNPLQYEFLTLLVGHSPDLFLVGDPNQAIYGFNGADKTLFDTLPGMNGGAHVVTLPSNYRCTPQIVRMAVDTLAADNQSAQSESKRDDGSVVQLQRCADQNVETDFICRTVLSAKGKSRQWSDIAVLTRINATADFIRQALNSAGIPVRSARRGGAWGRAVAAASALTNRDALATWAADILDTGEYTADDADYLVAEQVRIFLDNNRSGSVDGRTFSSWLVTSADIAETDGVDVLTFHAAKGREWSCVVVAGMEKGLLPYRSARSVQERSEEARLAYVALTRAADELIITWTDQRDGRTSGPSPFLPTVTTESPVRAAPPQELRAIARAHKAVDPIAGALELWRQEKARNSRVDPDGILSPRKLRSIAKHKPENSDELKDLTDPFFVRRFGDEILELLSSVPDR